MTLILHVSVYSGHLHRGGYKGTVVTVHGHKYSYNATVHMDSAVHVKVYSVAIRAIECYLFAGLKHFNISLKLLKTNFNMYCRHSTRRGLFLLAHWTWN